MSAALMFRSALRPAVQAAGRRTAAATTLCRQTPRMMSTYFTPAHEYGKVDGKIATVGITDFAQAALGDIVFVDLPEVGDEFEKGDSFGSVESVKAASDVYAPVSGTITEINEILGDEPGMVNSHAETDAWFVKIEMEDDSELDDLMDAGAYKEHCEKEAH
eukprot:CAMPEP_0197734142 /NCGR_PEP_ID=MMETSP1434-20131217/44263_1 /TAXON_ID=265543 /ORGANISM="Minutocellus polymorphus, Strain CCMP3303" /LENGTH=160 /DNA_ID=CAMNT_0043321549 /DNA_START=85 /DNA_END=567 /DNA_ORIENTATION=+